MRNLSSICMRACLFLSTSLPVIQAITLNQFQPIDGFSQACVNAYNTPLSGCTASDFQQHSCSTTCIAFLEALTKILVAECGGTSALPYTLIGSFFNNQGTSALCPNVLSENEGANDGVTSAVGVASTYTLDSYGPTSTYIPLSFTTATLPLISAAPSQSSSSSTLSSSAEATTTEVAIVNTTVAPNRPSLTPTISHSSADHTHAQASSTSTSSTDTATSHGNGNDGGSPLDVGSSSSSNHNAKIEAWVLGLVIGSASLALAL